MPRAPSRRSRKETVGGAGRHQSSRTQWDRMIRRLKTVLPQTQFVMLTVYEDDNHIFRAMSAGASGYLLKQTPRQMLLAALKDVHNGGSPMSSSIARKSCNRSGIRLCRALRNLATRNGSAGIPRPGIPLQRNRRPLGIERPNRQHVHPRIYEKLHVRSRSQALAIYANLPSRIG